MANSDFLITQEPVEQAGGSTTSRIVQELRRQIITGVLRPGEKLRIDALRQDLKTGATPIREALSLLTSDHLVERLDQRGFRVAPATNAHFADNLKTRCWLEERAIRESIEHGGTDWEERVVLAHHRLSRAKREEEADFYDPVSWEALHKEFHLALISACGSEILLRICSQLYDQNVRYRYLASHSSGYASRDVSSEHNAIFAAAMDRNAELTVEILLEHYTRTGGFLKEHI